MPAPQGYARIAASLSLALFVAVSTVSASASAVTAQWQAKIGPGGADGTSTIQIFSTGAGSLSIALKGLAHGTTYTDAVYRGTCSKLSTKLLALPPLKTTAKGTFARTTALAAPQATLVNKKGEVFRLVAGKESSVGRFSAGQSRTPPRRSRSVPTRSTSQLALALSG